MTGTILLWTAFVASLVSTFLFSRAALGKGRMVREARWSMLVSVVSVATASVLLLVYILQHRFDVNYVYSYSGRDLPTYLLVTTFWAGQEGSFLLWALFGSLFALVLRDYARGRRVEYEAMTIYGVVQTFLLMLVVFKSPFVPTWEVFPKDLAVGQVPPDGRGLNPLLQNLWMAIHPPILFVGFASLAVPFSLALSALWRRSYQEWISVAMPWVLFAVVALGAGIMLGGYWAYGVLGWGGWWGWDPVENSSLIPWIVSVALLHTIVVQKKNGGFVRTNFALAILAYILVVWSTFLTRSGVLGSASVHSFVDPGTFVYTLLIVWVASVLIFGMWMLRLRWKELRPGGAATGILRKDTMLGWTTAVLAFVAFVVFVGTNWPLFASGSLEPSFYNKSTLPMGILLAVLLGVSLSLQWEEIPFSVAIKRMLFPLIGAIVVVIGLLVAGITAIGPLAFSFASAFALFMSLRLAVSMLQVDWKTTGGPLAHAGLAVLFLGIVGSGFYSEQKTVSLPLGQATEVLGYTLTYAGNQVKPDGKYEFLVKAQHGTSSFETRPVMFSSEYNQSVMRNPDYVSFLTRDFYVEPVSVEQAQPASGGQLVHLAKGQSTTVDGRTITFERFDMQAHNQDADVAGGMSIGAVLTVKQGKSSKSMTAMSMFVNGEARKVTPVAVDATTELRLVGMNVGGPSGTTVILEIASPGAVRQEGRPELLVVEASVKPFIGLVWIGTVICLAGVILAIIRRRPDSALQMSGTEGVKRDQRKDRTVHA